MDINQINTLMRRKKQGAQIILHNLSNRWARIHGSVKPGIYVLNENNKTKFLRSGYELQNIENENEFLVTDGVLIKKSHLSPNRRVCRILTLKNVLENYKELNSWAKTMTEKIYKRFKLKKIPLIKTRKIVKPNLLAKG
jgi:hypothetical protein